MDEPGSVEQHDYLSTACFHGLHDRCRKECKFCGVACKCDCHNQQVSEPGLNWELSENTQRQIAEIERHTLVSPKP